MSWIDVGIPGRDPRDGTWLNSEVTETEFLRQII